MLCYYYPPLMDVGCKRSVAFSKYFKKHGWTPYVLSVKNPDRTYCTLGNDVPPREVHTEYSYSIINVYKFLGKLNGLLARILKLIGIELKENYFYHIFCIPDIFFGWIPLTTIKGLRLIKEHDIKIIYVSCPPFSAAVIGVLLKAICKKPLVIDFRDPFAVERLPFSKLPKFKKKMDRCIEKWFLKHTDILIVVTHELRKRYITDYPQAKNKIFTIHNGVDIELISKELPASKYSKFTIIYAGLYFYSPYEWDVEFFFKALAILKEKEIVNKNNFQFLFYGSNENRICQIAIKFDVDDLVIANSRISYNDIIHVISKSHLQLLRNRDLVIPSKLYEGISLNVPFLATIPGGEAKEIINEYSPSSYVIIKQSAEEVSMAISDAIEKYEKGKILDNRVNEFLEHFSRERLAVKLIDIIEEIMKQYPDTQQPFERSSV